MRIKNILKETIKDILIEAMDINSINQKYYPKINNNDFLSIINADPTYDSNLHPDKMGLYGKWLLNQFQNNNLKLEDLYKIKNDLTIFDKYKPKINNKDINSYSVSELYDVIKPFQENPNIKATHAEEIRDIKGGAEKVYEDNQWIVIVPHTEESSCYYGKGTRWCTAADKGNNMFDEYNKDGNLYINIDKVNKRKYQFHFESDSFMDEEDNNIKSPVYETIGLSNELLEFYKNKYPNEWFEIKYDYVDSFSKGLARVKLNGKYGFIDKEDNVVIPIKYDWVGDFSDGLSGVALNDKYGFIDKQDNVVIPIKYDWVGDFHEGLAEVKLNNKWGFINKQGTEIIPIKYDWVWHFSEGLARVKLNGKYGFIDKQDNVVIPIKYDEVGDFFEELAGVRLNNKWGFIDKQGTEIIPIKYDGIGGFHEGLAIVNLNGKYGIVDRKGNWYNTREEYQNKTENINNKNQLGESIKRIVKSRKKIKINELQEQILLKSLLTEELQYSVEPNKVLKVKSFLDKNFKRAQMNGLNSNGMPSVNYFVGMIDSDDNVIKNMTAVQLYDLLDAQNFIRKMFTDNVQRKKFIIQVLKDWYYKRINNQGFLSVNLY